MKAGSKQYLIIGDLRGSTRASARERERLLQKLERTTADLNARLAPKPLRGLAINYGDEIAGIFRTPEPLYEVMSAYRAAIGRDAGIRFVVAYGEVGTMSKDLVKVGGEIYKIANAAMSRLKPTPLFCAWRLPDALESETLSALCNAVDALSRSMTDYQYQVLELMRTGASQTDIAQTLGKFPQSVSDAVKRGRIDEILAAESVIAARLARYKAR